MRKLMYETSQTLVYKVQESQSKKVAVVIGNEDYLEPSKVIYNFTKDHDFYKIKGGVIEGKVMTAEEIITLAK